MSNRTGCRLATRGENKKAKGKRTWRKGIRDSASWAVCNGINGLKKEFVPMWKILDCYQKSQMWRGYSVCSRRFVVNNQKTSQLDDPRTLYYPVSCSQHAYHKARIISWGEIITSILCIKSKNRESSLWLVDVIRYISTVPNLLKLGGIIAFRSLPKKIRPTVFIISILSNSMFQL